MLAAAQWRESCVQGKEEDGEADGDMEAGEVVPGEAPVEVKVDDTAA